MAVNSTSNFVLPINKVEVINDYPVQDVPDLPKQIDIQSAVSILPVGYSHIVTATFNEDSGTLDLLFNNAEEGNNVVKISSRIFAPEINRNIFPNFILEVSSKMSSYFDYSQYPFLILNQNQILWLMIKHRLMQYEGQNIHYTHLLRSDISALASYAEYDRYSSRNAILKSKHYYVVMSPWTDNEEVEGGLIITNPIGEYLSSEDKRVSIDKQMMDSISRDLPIQPASESMASKSAKFVIYPHEKSFYKCAGYSTMMASQSGIKYPVIRTVFPNKPNIPARIKTHILADCFSFQDPSGPIFSEDVYKDGQTDSTIRNALVVFDEMNGNTGRLLCGEIEAAEGLSRSIIYKEEIIKEQFKQIYVNEGETVLRSGNKFILGINNDDEEIAIYNAISVEVMSISDMGYGDNYRVVVRCDAEIGSSRILSTTGLKGVTKPKPNLGLITPLNLDGNPYCDEDGLELVYDVDLVCGMNSVKAKGNTIHLARAAFSHVLGFNQSEYLSSMNADQIAESASKIGKCIWTDEFGNEKLVWCGIVQIRVNELSYMFNNVKHQKFMAESGRYLRDNGYADVYEKIWELGVDPELKELVIELYKILTDDTGCYARLDNLPIFTPDNLAYGIGPAGSNTRIFDLSDCQFDLQPMYPYESKILDESYNKGWYLDLSYRDGGYTRMPSAKLINLLTKQLPDGSISYPVIFRNVSTILRICMEFQEDNTRNVGYLNERGHSREYGSKSQIARYLQVVSGMIYKHRDMTMSHSKLIDVFMKPQITGVGMKQMTDAMVPENVVVILDDSTYKKLAKSSDGYYDKKGYFNALCIRNPVVWKSQTKAFKVWNYEAFQIHLFTEYDLDIDVYLSRKYCGEVLLLNPFDALAQMSDVDGDLMPLFMINDFTIQGRLEDMYTANPLKHYQGGVDNIMPEEINWVCDYTKDELSGNDDLDLEDRPYQLYSIPLYKNPDSSHTFKDYFRDSIIAKGDVGIATTQLWQLNTLLEVYKSKCDLGEVIDIDGTEVKITNEAIRYILYAYTRLIQDLVIRSIKHVVGGSSGFNPFLLDNIASGNQLNTVKYLINVVGVPKDVVKSFYRMIHWTKNTEARVTVRRYIAMFNSGRQILNFDDSLIEDIEDKSFYGELLSEMREVRDRIAGRLDDSTYVHPSYLMADALDSVPADSKEGVDILPSVSPSIAVVEPTAGNSTAPFISISSL